MSPIPSPSASPFGPGVKGQRSPGPPGMSPKLGDPGASENKNAPPKVMASMSSQSGGAQPGPPETRPFPAALTAMKWNENGPTELPRMSPGSAPAGKFGFDPGVSVGEPGASEKKTTPNSRARPGKDQSKSAIWSSSGGPGSGFSSERPIPRPV